MKTLNPRVFLRDGELYAFVEEVPEAPRNICNQCLGKGWITGIERPCGSCNPGGEWRSSKTANQGYSDLMRTAKASAIKVKNQEDAMQFILKPLRVKLAKEKQVSEASIASYGIDTDHLKPDSIYTLEGYQMEVEEGCKHDCCPVDGRCEHCANPIKLAIISPVVEQPPSIEIWKEIYMDFKDGEGWIAFAARMSKRFTITRQPLPQPPKI